MNEQQRAFLRETASACLYRGDLSGFDTRDIGEALGDYLLARCGLPGAEHPVASLMDSRGTEWRAVLEAFDPLHGASQTGHPDERVLRGLNSSDFAVSLASGAQTLAQKAYDQQQDVARLLLPLQVRDFKGASFPTLAVGDLAAAEVPEAGEIKTEVDLTLAASLESVALQSRPFLVRIGRRLLTGDAVAAIRLLTQGVARAARRAEATSLATVLENTDTLADSLAFFNEATIGNLVDTGSGAAPSVTTLNVGCAALWDVAGAPAKYLIVPPGLEITARVLAASVTVPGADWQLEVVVLPTLSSETAWYLSCDPSIAPSVTLLTLEGSSGSFSISPLKKIPSSDDFGVKILIDYRIARVGRSIFKNAGA